MIERKNMIDLEVIETDDVPKDILDWYEKDIPFNTLYLTVKGPNPITGEYFGILTYVYGEERNRWERSHYWYRDKKGEAESSYTKRGVPRRYRESAVRISYYFASTKINYKIVKDLPGDDPGRYIAFMSEDELKNEALSDERIQMMKRSIAHLYVTETKAVSYVGTIDVNQ